MDPTDPDQMIVTKLMDPWKILFLDMDLAMLTASVGLGLLMAGFNTFIVIIVPGALAYWLQKARQDRPRGYLVHLAYWWMPPMLLQLKRTPPMYCTRTVG
jgi:type IV conjugative transfer system protein TraL